MTVAPFFDKTALAAAEILQDYDRAAFHAALGDIVVGLAFDSAAVSSAGGRYTLELTANLLSRLYPRLAVVPLDTRSAEHRPTLEAAIRAINPDIELTDTLKAVRVCLAVGERRAEGAGLVLYLGSTGWVTRLSASGPVGVDDTGNPFGPGAAACLGAARVFRVIFGSQLRPAPPAEQEDVRLSLLDLNPVGLTQFGGHP